MFIAISQYGHKVNIKKHPRKELMKLFNGRVSKMYEDRSDGTYHVGYVIGKLWFAIYKEHSVNVSKPKTASKPKNIQVQESLF